MATSSKKKVAGRLTAIFLAASLLGGCTTTVIGQFNSVSDGECITADQRSFTTDTERNMNQLLQTIRQTPSGRSILGYSERASTEYCFNKAMRGGDANARFYGWANRADVLPKAEVARVIGSIVHEARHKQQYATGVTWHQGYNVPVAERALMRELIEADARLAAIVFAYEMKAKGQSEYMNSLRRDYNYRPMVNAFENHMRSKPGDMIGAMQAGMLQFRGNLGLKNLYQRDTKKTARAFDPNRKAQHIITSSELRTLGQTAYGNYMNDRMIGHFVGLLKQDQTNAPSRPRFGG